MKKYISSFLMIGAIILSSFFSSTTVWADSSQSNMDNTYIINNETTENIDILNKLVEQKSNKLYFTPNPKFIEFLEETNREATVTQTDKGMRILVYNHSDDPTGHPIPSLKMTIPPGWQIVYSVEAIDPSPQTVGEGIVNETNFIYYVLVEKTGDVFYTDDEILAWYLSMNIGSESITTTAITDVTTTTTDTTITTTTDSMETTTETTTTSDEESTATTTQTEITSTTTTVETTSSLSDTTTETNSATTTNVVTTDENETTASIETSTTETTTIATTHIVSDEELCDWAVKDYEGKTGITPAGSEIEYTSEGTAVITLTDTDGNILDVYTIDPTTGTGTESDGGEVNLPQTGYSKWYHTVAAVAACMIGVGGTIVVSSGVAKKKRT